MNAELRKKEKVLNLQLQQYLEEVAETKGGLKMNPRSEHLLKNKNY